MTEDYMTVGTHVSLVRRHWVALLIFLVVGVAIGLVLAPLEKPTYAASTEVLVPDLTGTPLADQSIADQVELVTADATTQAVLTDLKLDESATTLVNSVSVSNPDDTRVLDISASSGNRREAADVANSFANAYLASISNQVSTVETSLANYYTAQLNVLNPQLIKLRDSLPGQAKQDQINTRGEISRLEARRSKINSALGLAEQPLAPPQNGRVLRAAVTPSVAARPLVRGVILGLGLGIVLGLAFIYLWDRRDDSVREEAGVAGMLNGALVLGRIPQDRSLRGATVVDAANATGGVVEAFRALATNLRFLVGGRSGRADAGGHNVVVVTSANETEGKTTVAANIAVSAARLGQRVILVDADLRSPAVAGLFDLTDGAGLAEVLRGDDAAHPVLHEVGVPNLRVLTAGSQVADPAELLSTDRAQQLLQELRTDADLVILDSAPLLPVADTLPLAAAADHVVLVIRRGRSKSATVRAAMDRMSLVGARLSGAVLVGVSAKMVASGYAATTGGEVQQPTSAAGA